MFCLLIGNTGNQVWFDPTRDFAPIQIKLTLKFEDGINIVERMSDVRLEQRDGIWIVADAVLTFENPRLKDPRKRRFATRFSVRDYHVGIELSDDIFQVEFPIGTRVYDEILKTGYIVGEGIYVTNEDGSPEFVRNDSLDYKYEMEAPESKLPSPNSIELKARIELKKELHIEHHETDCLYLTLSRHERVRRRLPCWRKKARLRNDGRFL